MGRFSTRTPADLRLNLIAEARARLGTVPFDLTVSNPTRCDLPYPDDLLASLAHPAGLVYRPDPRGDRRAREAIAGGYSHRNLTIDPDRVVLTASTSEAYGFLFRLLADPGDVILVPAPSYPLFEQLTRLDGVSAAAYALDPEAGWRIDRHQLETAPGRIRAVIVVHPNNPTGSFVHPDDADWLVDLCRRRDWALIADEVFLSYRLQSGRGHVSSFAAADACLTFALGGLSKSIGLPQLKLAWIVTSGPPAIAEEAMQRLDHVADAYLSVGTPVALAAPDLLIRGERIREVITTRCVGNLDRLVRQAAGTPAVSVVSPEGGWSVALRIPRVMDEESFVLRLLAERGVAVHPGFFFNFPGDGYVVLSLLPPPQVFEAGVAHLLEAVRAIIGESSHSGR